MAPEILDDKMVRAVRRERNASVEVLLLIKIAERVNHAQRTGFSDVYDWLETKHGYSHPAAVRRVHAARLINAVKEVAQYLRDGSLTLTTASRLQSVLRQEELLREKISPARRSKTG